MPNQAPPAPPPSPDPEAQRKADEESKRRLAESREKVERERREAERKAREELEAKAQWYRDRGVEPGRLAWFKVWPDWLQMVAVGLLVSLPIVLVMVVILVRLG
jgi:hypothetical protein